MPRGVYKKSEEHKRKLSEAKLGQLIEASSLGTPAARAFRESVSDEDVDRIMGRVNEQTAGKPMSKTEREAAEARFRAQEVIREHFPNRLPAAATVQCGCGAVLSSETLWSNHLADKLFPA